MTKGRVSDAAAKKATGRTWQEWFDLLDELGARRMTHYDIAQYLSTTHIKNGWWAQMVTVEYERAVGLRQIKERAAGFLVSIHKTVERPVAALEAQWRRLTRSRAVAARRLIELPSRTKRKIFRYKTDIGALNVSIDSHAPGKSRIMVESAKLPSRAAVDREREFWKGILSTLST